MYECLPFYSLDIVSNSFHCHPHDSRDVRSENLVFDQLLIPALIDIFPYSRHFSARYCIDIVKINSVSVTDGS